MKQVGKKGKEWEDAKKFLKQEFDKLEIYHCEFRGIGCWGEGTTFAHVLRRRHLGRAGSDERKFNLTNVIRCCIPCHDYLDTVLGEKYGGAEIQRIIDFRNSGFIFGDL